MRFKLILIFCGVAWIRHVAASTPAALEDNEEFLLEPSSYDDVSLHQAAGDIDTWQSSRKLGKSNIFDQDHLTHANIFYHPNHRHRRHRRHHRHHRRRRRRRRRRGKGRRRRVRNALFKYLYAPGIDFPSEGFAKRTVKRGKIKYEGFFNFVSCRPIACRNADPVPCAVYDADDPNYFYDPGNCCLGPNCTATEGLPQCGEQCKLPPESCSPNTGDCASSDCFQCERDEVNDVDLYNVYDRQIGISCFATGYKKLDRKGNGYKWGIICGKNELEYPGGEEDNKAVGEVDCFAVRKGTDEKGNKLSNLNGGIVSAFVPCQFLQLLECGCGPVDPPFGPMNPFDLPAPTEPCKTKDDCHILCADVPKELPNLCDSFGGIDYFEGGNAGGFNTFCGKECNLAMEDEFELKIY